MKFLKNYPQYSENINTKINNRIIEKYEKTEIYSTTYLSINAGLSIFFSFLLSISFINNFNYNALLGVPLFFIFLITLFTLFYSFEKKYIHLDKKLDLLANEFENNIRENIPAIMFFLFEVKQFLATQKTDEKDKNIIRYINKVTESYALNKAKHSDIYKIMQIHKYINDENIFKKFIAFSKDAQNKISQYKNQINGKDDKFQFMEH